MIPVRRWLRRLQPTGLILLYHRVTELESDPQLLSVTPQHFAEHLEVLWKKYHVTSLRCLADGRLSGNAQRRCLAITFDDGYSDNLHEARPLLAKMDCPATVFVTSGYIESDQEFWWDTLEQVLLETQVLPKQLTLNIGGRNYTWELDDAAQRIEQGWNVLVACPRQSRQAAYLELAALLKRQPGKERQYAIDELRLWAGTGSRSRPSHRGLSCDELRTLAADGLIEIGAHTVSHPSLAALALSEQRSEIIDGKIALDRILNHPVHSFSFPFGGQADFDAETIRLVRAAGFERACANIPGTVHRLTNRYQIPRMLVRDWDGDEFARRLDVAFAS